MKRRVLGLLLFLLIIPFFMGCVETTTIAVTTQETTVSTTEAEVALGTVTFEIITLGDDPDTQEVETEYVSNTVVVEYFEGDTLFDLLDANFTLEYQDSTYGRYITSIDTLIPGENQYIAFYIDGSYSMTGIDDTVLTDGAVYQFKIEGYEG